MWQRFLWHHWAGVVAYARCLVDLCGVAPASTACRMACPRRVSAPPQETAYRGHHLIGSLRPLTVLGAHHARMGVTVEQPEGDLVECGLDRRDLGQDIDAVTLLGDHPLDAAYLPLDPSQPSLELTLRG